MYHHVKKLMYTVRVDEPNPAFGNMLLEQFGGANGELAAAMQYSIQGLNCDEAERLKEVFGLIGLEAETKPCKGMAGLVAEGQEVITEGKQKDDVAADLALIAAAQKVEHYEISSYLSARALASQAGNSEAALLLNQTLLEEERSDKGLSRLATLLMEEVGRQDAASADAGHAEPDEDVEAAKNGAVDDEDDDADDEDSELEVAKVASQPAPKRKIQRR